MRMDDDCESAPVRNFVARLQRQLSDAAIWHRLKAFAAGFGLSADEQHANVLYCPVRQSTNRPADTMNNVELTFFCRKSKLRPRIMPLILNKFEKITVKLSKLMFTDFYRARHMQRMLIAQYMLWSGVYPSVRHMPVLCAYRNGWRNQAVFRHTAIPNCLIMEFGYLRQ